VTQHPEGQGVKRGPVTLEQDPQAGGVAPWAALESSASLNTDVLLDGLVYSNHLIK